MCKKHNTEGYISVRSHDKHYVNARPAQKVAQHEAPHPPISVQVQVAKRVERIAPEIQPMLYWQRKPVAQVCTKHVCGTHVQTIASATSLNNLFIYISEIQHPTTHHMKKLEWVQKRWTGTWDPPFCQQSESYKIITISKLSVFVWHSSTASFLLFSQLTGCQAFQTVQQHFFFSCSIFLGVNDATRVTQPWQAVGDNGKVGIYRNECQ